MHHSVSFEGAIRGIEQLVRQGDFQAAGHACRELLVLDPADATAWAWLGIVALQAGDCSGAVSALRNAVQLQPADAVSWHHLSLALQEQGLTGEAEACSRRAVALRDMDAAFWRQLGNVLFAQERFAEAAAAHAGSVEREPGNPTAWNVTFGCFNNPTKWTPQILDAWSEILRRVPGSRLLLKYHGLQEPETQDHFRRGFENRGVDADRIILEGRSPHHELLRAYQRVDIALDTQPYSGGVTTCEALWMGVPVITFPGRTFAGRHAYSHLSNAGYSQFVAPDMNGYIELAVT